MCPYGDIRTGIDILKGIFKMSVCEFCGVKLLSDDDVCSFDGRVMCEDCYDSETRYCDCCGSRIWNDDDCGDDNVCLCSYCRNNHYVSCEDCGRLNDGMELVTHPMSLDYHMNSMPWKEVVSKAVSLGYRSHKTNTCGLHVHVSRKAFGEDKAEQDTAISRVLFFVERFWQELLKFSRRTEAQINRWAARYGMKDDPKQVMSAAKEKNMGRYACINLCNYSTIEFRIFRGTLKYNTIIATLQLVSRICTMAAEMTDEDFTALSWPEFVSSVTEPELITYLKERRLYINEPINEEEDD